MTLETRSPWIVFAAGGVLETAFLPKRIFDLRVDRDVRTSVALSAGALDFVTTVAMSAVSGSPVYDANTQLDARGVPMHLSLAEADLLVLVPATARIFAECALGIVSCTVTRLFAFTPKERIVLAPALHPRMDLRLYRDHEKKLVEVGCTVLARDDLFASWAEVERHVVARLSLTRRPPTLGPVLLPDLAR